MAPKPNLSYLLIIWAWVANGSWAMFIDGGEGVYETVKCTDIWGSRLEPIKSESESEWHGNLVDTARMS